MPFQLILFASAADRLLIFSQSPSSFVQGSVTISSVNTFGAYTSESISSRGVQPYSTNPPTLGSVPLRPSSASFWNHRVPPVSTRFCPHKAIPQKKVRSELVDYRYSSRRNSIAHRRAYLTRAPSGNPRHSDVVSGLCCGTTGIVVGRYTVHSSEVVLANPHPGPLIPS